MIRIPIIVLAVTLALFFCCTQVTGTGSEVEGKCAVRGNVVDGCGEPVEGASVRIRPAGYIAFSGDVFDDFDTLTDKNGFFGFDTIPVNSYVIEINQARRFGALHQFIVDGYDNLPIVLPPITLTPTGTIFGRINLPLSDDTARPWVALYNVDYLVKAPITQEFKFIGIPAGIYSLRIVPYLESKLVVELHDIEVASNSVIDVGTLNFTFQSFFKGCTSYECDTIAIRSILDSNGLTEVPVTSVITTDTASGRVIGLDLSGRSIVTITKEIGSLSQLINLDLRSNDITSLPGQIGYLSSLKECRLDSNELRDLPPEFTYLSSLKLLTVSHNRLYRLDPGHLRLQLTTLDLSFNELTLLPDIDRALSGIQYLYLGNNRLFCLPSFILELTPAELSAGNNRLCSLTSAFSRWLIEYDRDWDKSQDCLNGVSIE